MEKLTGHELLSMTETVCNFIYFPSIWGFFFSFLLHPNQTDILYMFMLSALMDLDRLSLISKMQSLGGSWKQVLFMGWALFPCLSLITFSSPLMINNDGVWVTPAQQPHLHCWEELFQTCLSVSLCFEKRELYVDIGIKSIFTFRWFSTLLPYIFSAD